MGLVLVSGKERLTALKVEKAKKHGYLSDGAGLYLKIRKGGSKQWAFIWTKKGKRTELSLGSASGAQRLSLKQAREQAEIIRDQIGSGLDPVQERKREESKLFLEVAETLYAKLLPTWKSDKTAAQWKRSIHIESKPLHSNPIAQITDADCRKVVLPVWEQTPETGSRLRKRLERIFSYAEAHGLREGLNPARWSGHFQDAMPGERKRKQKNLPAMPYDQIPAFIEALRSRGGVSALALEYKILTACRTNEVLKAQWSEIDIERRTWSIPEERMKNGLPHEVPLTDRMIEILSELEAVKVSDFVFPGQASLRPLSNMAMAMLMRRMGVDEYVPHAFRASFRTWCGNETNTPREVAEAALSHRLGNAAELAYSRGNALEKRRQLMQAWSDYINGVSSSDVIQFKLPRAST